MKKRVLSLIIALLLILSSVAVSAEVVNPQTDNSYVCVENKLYFEPDTAGWKNFEKMYCHIWEYETGNWFFNWQSKNEACVNKDGKWYYDLDMKAVSLKPGVTYACIFSNENGQYTYDLIFDTTVLGDSAYCDGTFYNSPDDGSRKPMFAFWRNQDKEKFGPVMQITGWGPVVGTCVPAPKTKIDLFKEFLTSTTLLSAQIFSGLNDQDLLDHIGAQLGFYSTDVERCVRVTGVDVQWSMADSKLDVNICYPHGIKTVDEAVKEYELQTGEKVETNRYYFLMPNGKNGDMGDDDSVDALGYPVGHYGEYADSWFVKTSDGHYASITPCIYWWGNNIADPEWVGYLPSGVASSDPCVFYADVPKAVDSIIWNNGINIGMDPESEVYYLGCQTDNIQTQYYDPGESPNYPDGVDSFDNMIFVIDPDFVAIKDFSPSPTCGGEWYHYYGDGCYGIKKDGTQADCLRDDHHDVDGNHIDLNPGVLGDTDCDGFLGIMDATFIQRYIALIDVFDDFQKKVADFDKDGEISIMDATEIQRYLAGYRN